MALINPSISIIILNVNELNYSIKILRMAEWIFKKYLVMYYLQDIIFTLKDHIESERIEDYISYK